MEPWGRHRDDESLIDKVVGRWRDVRRVRRRLNASRFDVLLIKTSHESRSLLRDLPLLASARRRVPKVIVQFHGGRSDLLVTRKHGAFKAATAALFRLCDGVLVLSSEEARDYQLFWPGGRFRVVANPYVPPDWDQGTPSQADIRTDGTPSLLFVGRLVKEKGIIELVTAFAALSKRRKCRLVIVGDGPLGPLVARSVTELGLRGKVKMTGYLTGKSLRDEYLAADVFVFPSYREGFPTAITEALAEGLPVVTTRTRGMADHLREDENALFVAPRDSTGLTSALERILTDSVLRGHMASANRAKHAEFAPWPVAKQYLAMLREIVELT